MSKTKKIIFLSFTFAAFLLSGCTLLNQINELAAATPTLEAVSNTIQATAIIEETAVPTLSCSPSPNWLDTQVAGERENNAQQILAANKRLTAINLELTLASGVQTQSANDEISSARAASVAGTQLVIAGTKDQADRNWQVVIPTLIVAGTQAMYTEQKTQSEVFLNCAIGTSIVLIVIVLLIAIIIPRRGGEQAAQDEAQKEKQSETQEVSPKPRTFVPINKNGMGLHISPPGNHAHFMTFALAVCSGRKGFSKIEWEGADSPYNRETYGAVYNWLWQHKLVELRPGGKIVWSAEGQEWVDGWFERNLVTSPAEDVVPVLTNSPAEISQPPETQAAENGGEVGGTTPELEQETKDNVQ